MSVFVVPVVALCIPLVIVPTALILRHARVVREMAHAERMRALEVRAYVPPPSGLNWPGAAVCIALGAGVPIGAFALATLGVLSGEADNQVFGIALVVSCVALWSAKSLADRMLGHTDDESSGEPRSTPAGKPANYDPDAFDVVGSRG